MNSEEIEPVALVFSRRKTASDLAGLFRYEVYDAYFRSCQYWASDTSGYADCTE
jgi:hypothetical protein